MKPHRIFIAINLPEDVKNKLLSYQKNWSELPARWTIQENLHLTLVFLGNTSDQELKELYDLINKKGESHKPFTLTINRIVYGPKPSNPRMIWALLEKSPELLALQKDIEQTLEQRDHKLFSPHLSLAKLNTFQVRQMEREELPEIDEDISLSFKVQSIEVMQSELRRSGAQYTICQEIPLRKDS